MLYQKPVQTITSKNTCIRHKTIPTLFSDIEFTKFTTNLDYGGGKYENISEHLKKQEVINLVFDPYNRTEEHNDTVIALLNIIDADSATLCNVLNVVDSFKERKAILYTIHSHLKDSGMLYISIYQGDRSSVSKQTTKGWQNNFLIHSYLHEIMEFFELVSVDKNKGILKCRKNNQSPMIPLNIDKRYPGILLEKPILHF